MPYLIVEAGDPIVLQGCIVYCMILKGVVMHMKGSLEGMIKTDKNPLTIAGLVCSNFEQASQKQKRENLSKLFALLARSFEIQAKEKVKDSGKAVSEEELITDFQKSIEQDLQTAYTEGESRVRKEGNRGALRALTWGSKVSAIQKSVLKRYLKFGDELLKGDQAIHVCQACGFIGIGEAPPDICPVCKAPSSRFTTLAPKRR